MHLTQSLVRHLSGLVLKTFENVSQIHLTEDVSYWKDHASKCLPADKVPQKRKNGKYLQRSRKRFKVRENLKNQDHVLRDQVYQIPWSSFSKNMMARILFVLFMTYVLRFFRTQPPGIMARFLDYNFFGGLKCITDRSLFAWLFTLFFCHFCRHFPVFFFIFSMPFKVITIIIVTVTQC